MNSLRTTIITPITALLAAFCLAAAAASFGLVTYETNKFLDAQLQEIAIKTGSKKLRLNPTEGTSTNFETEYEDQLVVQVWDQSGATVYRGGPLVDIPWTPQPGLADAVANGQMWRVYRWSTARYNAQVAQAWSARREIASFAATGAALPLLLTIPLAWLLIRWSIDRTLRGFHRLSSDIGKRSLDAHEPLRPVGVPVEITPLITAIDELVARYRYALEIQRRFVADAVHELRTPLAALQIQADNLLASDLSEQSRELANELGDGVRRSSRLVRQLLEMARTEGRPAISNQTIDLVALVTSVLANFVTLASANGIHLERDVVDPISGSGDLVSIREILSILLDNAIRYSSRDSVVTVKLSLTENQPRIDVMDSGPGIPEDVMPFIYDRFFRAAPQEIEGSGLGLAIAKTAADRNNIGLFHQRRTDAQGTVATIVFNQRSA
ncbi:two-component sensor histidine kinase [Nitrobacter winogradskyi]|uniref:histidine kinase n=1 Tax=Nitrobacter winogradskyi TaxID=913 RepID=A0A4Y3WHG4_NITWI|nr:ATP-binding protein [Nitrobacter winogradskyi]GEC17641.1 two-component sensor histidine kinase [Nitrobacter winogradskyi]